MASMQSPTQLMMDGICGTQVVLVFITKRYIELVSECFQQSDLDCTTGPVIRDNQTTISPGQRTSSVAETKAGETTTFADMVDEDSALGVRWSNIDEDYDCPNPTKRELLFALRCRLESHTVSDATLRRAPYLKSVVPIIMEKSCKDPETWGPLLGPALGTRLRLDLSDYEVPSPDLLDAIERAKKAQEKGGENKKAQRITNKKAAGRTRGRIKGEEAAKDPDRLLVGRPKREKRKGYWLRSSVSWRYISERRAIYRGDSAKTESSAGLHYSWLRKRCLW